MLKSAVLVALAGSAAAFCGTPGLVSVGPTAPSAVSARSAQPLRHATYSIATVGRRGGFGVSAAADDLGDMFQSAGGIKFDLELSDNENMAIAMTKCEKITESEPAWALFGDDKTDSLQRVGVRIVEMPLKENAVFIGAVKLPRSPARSCFADTLRTPAIMVEKGGSIYRTGRIGTKLTEYLGKEMKKEMGPSYPPKFKQGDMVKMELNKATGVFKCWVNDGEPFMVDGVAPNAKFFVNAEAKSTQFEIQALD